MDVSLRERWIREVAPTPKTKPEQRASVTRAAGAFDAGDITVVSDEDLAWTVMLILRGNPSVLLYRERAARKPEYRRFTAAALNEASRRIRLAYREHPTARQHRRRRGRR